MSIPEASHPTDRSLVVEFPKVLELFYRRELCTWPENQGFEGLKVVDPTALVPAPAKLDVRSYSQKPKRVGEGASL